MDIKCTSVSAPPGLLVMMSSTRYASVNRMTSLRHCVPYLHVRRKVYGEKGNLVTKQTLLKLFSSCVSFWGLSSMCEMFKKAGSESSV